MACAFGMEACKRYYTVKYVRLPDMLLDLQAARMEGNFATILKNIPIRYCWLLMNGYYLNSQSQKHGMYLNWFTNVVNVHLPFFSQYRESEWYQQICGGESTLADAIMDRISYDSYKINIDSIDPSKDLSMREVYGLDPIESK